jgi:uncharacterized OsmC-like protein
MLSPETLQAIYKLGGLPGSIVVAVMKQKADPDEPGRAERRNKMTDSTKTIEARNGVDTPMLFATLDAVSDQRDLAKFQFRASNRWISGTHSQSTINEFTGAGGEQSRAMSFKLDGDHPAALVGGDNAPTPVEYLLHALATCLTAGVANIASARGINLEEVESRVEGDINLLGLLGLDDSVRNGYQGVRISFRIKGDADEQKLRKVIEQSRARSAVYDVLTNGIPVDLEVEAQSS